MPNHKKKQRNATGKTKDMKNLRQSTLVGSVTGSLARSPTRPRKPSNAVSPIKQSTSRGPKRKRVSESSESSDIGAIRLEPATPVKKSNDTDDRSQSRTLSRTKKRRMLVVESGSDEENVYSSSSEAVAVPRPRRLRKLASAASDDSEEPPGPRASKRRSFHKGKAKQLDSEEDLSEEIDKHRTFLVFLARLILSWTRHH